MRSKCSALLGLFGLIAAILPLTAQAGMDEVGTPFYCNGGSFLVGLQGHIGVWIDQFQPVCAPWDAAAHRLGEPYTGPVFGNPHGGGADLKTAICPSGQALTRIWWEIATPNGPPGHVQNLHANCASVQDPSVMGSSVPRLGQAVITYDRIQESSCARGLLATSIVAYLDGINITILELECDTPANVMAAAPRHHDIHVGQHFPGISVGSDTVGGDWKTSEGRMTLKQDSADVLSGTYGSDHGRIHATRAGGNWTGWWAEDSSGHRCDVAHLNSYYWGNIELAFSDHNRHFEAVWTYCSAPIATGKPWTGDRLD